MKINVHITNQGGKHTVILSTNDNSHTVEILPKESGMGSKVNGGELLFLALATCYCNDIYREASIKGIEVIGVEVEVNGEFGGPGESAKSITYRAKVEAKADEKDIEELMRYTDKVTEIQNTLRQGISVTLSEIEIKSV